MTPRDVTTAVHRIAASLREFTGSTPAGVAYAIRRSDQWRMVLVSAIRELAVPTPDWDTIAAEADCSVFQAAADWERWSALNWRVRYDWLRIVEAELVLAEHVPTA